MDSLELLIADTSLPSSSPQLLLPLLLLPLLPLKNTSLTSALLSLLVATPSVSSSQYLDIHVFDFRIEDILTWIGKNVWLLLLLTLLLAVLLSLRPALVRLLPTIRRYLVNSC